MHGCLLAIVAGPGELGSGLLMALGGAELPLTNIAISTALAALGVRTGIVVGLSQRPEQAPTQVEEAGGQLQVGEETGGSGADTALVV